MYIICIIHVCASLLNFWNSFRANNTLPVHVPGSEIFIYIKLFTKSIGDIHFQS